MEFGAADADQSAAKTLNRGMVDYFKDDAWENAYVQNKLPDALSGIGEVKAGFGKELVGITPTGRRFDGFNGINYGGKLYVNLRSDVSFVNVAGHELWHSLEKERPDLFAWFADKARQHTATSTSTGPEPRNAVRCPYKPIDRHAILCKRHICLAETTLLLLPGLAQQKIIQRSLATIKPFAAMLRIQ